MSIQRRLTGAEVRDFAEFDMLTYYALEVRETTAARVRELNGLAARLCGAAGLAVDAYTVGLDDLPEGGCVGRAVIVRTFDALRDELRYRVDKRIIWVPDRAAFDRPYQPSGRRRPLSERMQARLGRRRGRVRQQDGTTPQVRLTVDEARGDPNVLVYRRADVYDAIRKVRGKGTRWAPDKCRRVMESYAGIQGLVNRRGSTRACQWVAFERGNVGLGGLREHLEGMRRR